MTDPADSGSVGSGPLLRVRDLTTRFHTDDGVVSAVDGISYDLDAGETLGIVGESGSGKSVSVRSLVGLIDEPGRVERGTVEWKGTDLLGASPSALRAVRGAEIGLVFQNAQAAFDPTATIGDQLREAIQAHRDLSKSAATDVAEGLLTEVGLPNPATNLDAYPHEYSGGMAQRAMIAMALAGEPDLLIADEPTTGLDVSIQSQIISLFNRLVREREMALILISHDIAVVSQVCERFLVMYAGRIAERGRRRDVLGDPKHPYTQLFLDSIPSVESGDSVAAIPGSPPNLLDPPSGCRFHPRCPKFDAGLCDGDDPPEIEFGDGHAASCYVYTDAYDPPAASDDTGRDQ